jgi:hypothetical protein
MMNSNQCVFCDKANNLNTQMTITIDGISIDVKICDDHAEDATVKSVKEAYSVKKKKIDDVIAQAKALGLNISESGGLVLASTPAPKTPAKPAIVEEMDVNSPDVIPTSKLKSVVQTTGGDVAGMAIAGHSSFDVNSLSEKLPSEMLQGHAEMALVEGRSGQPLAIPKTRIDGTGTTRITIQKSDDATLQNRFKKMATDSMNGNTPDFANAGYNNTTKTCPICRGQSTIKQNKKNILCPKCNGSGIISIY